MRWPASIALTIGLLLSAPARGQAPEQTSSADDEPGDEMYRTLIHDAVAEYGAARYEEALALLEQAYAIEPSSRVLRGMAKCQFELRRYAIALETIDRALKSTRSALPSDQTDELVALRARTLRYVGTLRIQVRPAHAQVVVDGRPVLAANLQNYVVDLGEHVIEVRAPGYVTTERVLDLPGGQSRDVTVDLPPVLKDRRTKTDAPALKSTSSTDAGVAIGAVVGAVGIAGLVGSVAWFVDRDSAATACSDAASMGAQCTHPGAIAVERDASMWTIGISSAVVVGSAIAITLLLLDREPTSAVAITF